MHFTLQKGYKTKAGELVKKIELQKFAISFSKLLFSANENFSVSRGNKH